MHTGDCLGGCLWLWRQKGRGGGGGDGARSRVWVVSEAAEKLQERLREAIKVEKI